MKHFYRVILVIIFIIICLLLGVTYYPRTGKGVTSKPVSFNSLNSEKVSSIEDNFSQNIKIETKTINPCVDEKLKNKPLPTNRIWSSVVFNCKIQGIFAFPFGIQTNNGGLTISLPSVKVADKYFFSDNNETKMEIMAAKPIGKVVLADYSDLLIKLNLLSPSEDLIYTVTIIQGSPYLYLENINSTLEVTTNGLKKEEGGSLKFTDSKNTKGIAIFNEQGYDVKNANEVTIKAEGNSKISIAYYNSPESYELVKRYSKNFVTKVFADYSVQEDTVSTNFNFIYSEDSLSKETYFGLLPHQYLKSVPNSNFTIDTVRGKQVFVPVQNSFQANTPRSPMVQELQIDKLQVDEKNLLADTLEKDASEVKTTLDTSYFGAKNLAKIARLIQIAEELGKDEVKTKLLSTLEKELSNWYTYSPDELSKFFSFDKTLGGLIANKSEFDSANYNDHHFHYGYFIYASAVLAKYDSEFVAKYGKFVDLLIKSIANNESIDNISNFPRFRVFDFYEGHSWASGYALFADGNNQESTSEAANAWYAIWLWSKNTGNKELEKVGIYLYSTEINSANEYWLNRPAGKSSLPEGYKQDINGIVWGNKTDFQTWFSPQPLDIYGIQFLPFTPGSIYLYNKAYIERDYKKISISIDRKEGKLLDMNIMYASMLKGRGISTDQELSKVIIDDGNSQTNFYYWIYFWDKVENLNKTQSKSEPALEILYKDGSKKLLN